MVAAVAAQTCSKERNAVGGEAFGAKYGSPAAPACKRFVKQLAQPMARSCKQERRRMGRDPFARKYRSSRSQPKALARCISEKLRKSLGQVCPEDLLDDEDLIGDDDFFEGEGDDLGEEDPERLSRAFATCSDDEGDEEEDLGDEEEDLGDDDSDF